MKQNNNYIKIILLSLIYFLFSITHIINIIRDVSEKNVIKIKITIILEYFLLLWDGLNYLFCVPDNMLQDDNLLNEF